MASVIIEQLEHYITMAKAQLKIVKKSLVITKSKKDVGVMVVVKACSQMKDCNNYFHETEKAFQTLIMKLESSNVEEKKDLQQQIDTQKKVVTTFKSLIEGGVSTYEKLNKVSNSVGGALYALEGKLGISQ